MQVHGVSVDGLGLIVVNSTMGNAGAIVDMINKEYATTDGGRPATLVMDQVEYNPKHDVVRDILDGVAGLTRVTPRKPVASVTAIKPARKVAAASKK